MSLDEVFAYFRDYDRSSFEVFAGQGNEPSEEDIAAFEASIGFALPDAFRQFTMSPLGGLYMAVKEDLWPRPKLYDVGPFWSFLYGFKVFGIAEGVLYVANADHTHSAAERPYVRLDLKELLRSMAVAAP